MKPFLTIAVDFDGTLVEDSYPNVGKPIQKNIDFIKEMQNKGAHIILYTCRAGAALKEAVLFCTRQGIVFSAVNEQDPTLKAMWKGESSCKPYADIYFDDKGYNNIEDIIKKLNK